MFKMLFSVNLSQLTRYLLIRPSLTRGAPSPARGEGR